MYLGKMVETAETGKLFASFHHPYTEALLNAIPQIGKKVEKKRILLTDEVPDVIHLPQGCRFHPRCRYKTDLCMKEDPMLTEIEPGHQVACHNPIN